MTTKRKNILLIVGFILVVVLAYRFAIKNTLDSRRQYNQLQETLQSKVNLPAQLSLLKKKELYLDSILGQYRLKATSLENNILNSLNDYADSTRLKIVAFNKPHSHAINGRNTNHYDFTVEGSYNKILGLIYALEQTSRYGEINHLQIIKKRNYKTGRRYLEARIILKNIS